MTDRPKVLLYSTGNYIQYPVVNHNGKEYFKNCKNNFLDWGEGGFMLL